MAKQYSHLVYCLGHGISRIRKGFEIHHINSNVEDNSLENLQMLSISEHIKLHRKENRRRDYTKEYAMISDNQFAYCLKNKTLELPIKTKLQTRNEVYANIIAKVMCSMGYS